MEYCKKYCNGIAILTWKKSIAISIAISILFSIPCIQYTLQYFSHQVLLLPLQYFLPVLLTALVRTPVDLVFDIPAEDPPVSYDSFVTDLEDRKRQAYCLVSKNLGVAAERMKRQYDFMARPLKFHRGD